MFVAKKKLVKLLNSLKRVANPFAPQALASPNPGFPSPSYFLQLLKLLDPLVIPQFTVLTVLIDPLIISLLPDTQRAPRSLSLFLSYFLVLLELLNPLFLCFPTSWCSQSFLILIVLLFPTFWYSILELLDPQVLLFLTSWYCQSSQILRSFSSLLPGTPRAP